MQSLTTRLDELQESNLAEVEFEFIWPKQDLKLFVPLLNRMDQMLSEVEIALLADPTYDEKLVCSILTLSRTIWENSTNRTIYASWEHILKLLSTTSIPVLDACLRFLVKPSHNTLQKKILQPFVPVLEILAQKASPVFSFWGDVQISFAVGKTDNIAKTFRELVQVHKVPSEKQFSLLHQLRVNNTGMEPIRYMALSILGNILSEDTFSKIFLYDPELVQTLAGSLLDAPPDIQFTALVCLDSISHYRSKLSETIVALNVGANHGILMQLLRKIIECKVDGKSPASGDKGQTAEVPQDTIDALFSFFAYLINTQQGSALVTSAGLVPLLTRGLESHLSYRNIAKCGTLLDNIIYGIPAAMATFVGCGGLEILVARIHANVGESEALGKAFSEAELAESALDPGVGKNRTLGMRMSLLRSMLKLILHMTQSSSTADGMRNLIDSSLPLDILSIFQSSRLFGHLGAFGLAINIMSTFIHNEPTSLSILQELGIPQAFLEAMRVPLPISAEISACPNAFGAICLNTSGLDAFRALNPINAYLTTFTDPEHMKTLLDNDVPHLIGNSMDEFMRHHPSFKGMVMEAIVKLLERVIAVGKEMTPEAGEQCSLVREPAATKMEAKICNYVDVCCRFLEGLFQNVGHCKDFVKANGIGLLLSIFSLPSIPYNFADSPSSYSLCYLLRIVIETHPVESVGQLTKTLDAAFVNVGKLVETHTESVINSYVFEKDKFEEAQKLYTGLVTLKCCIRVFADLYCSHSLSHSKSLNAIIQTFLGTDVLSKMYALDCACTWERILLADLFPPTWNEKDTDKLAIHHPGLSRRKSIAPIVPGEAPEVETAESQNGKVFLYLLKETTVELKGVFKGILKVMCAKKIADSLRPSIYPIVEQLATIMLKQVSWSVGSGTHKQTMIAQALASVHSLLTDEKTTNTSLQTIQFIAFDLQGGLEICFDLFKAALKDLDGADATYVDSCKYTIEVLLDIFQTLSNHKMVHDSPHTANLSRRVKTHADYFDSCHHIVKTRSRILPLLTKLWTSPSVKLLSDRSIKTLCTTLLMILKPQGEEPMDTDQQAVAERSHTVFGRAPPAAPVVADPARAGQLVDMGFSLEAAEHALLRCNNNTTLAADYLLSNPGAMFFSANRAAAPAAPAAAVVEPAQGVSDAVPVRLANDAVSAEGDEASQEASVQAFLEAGRDVSDTQEIAVTVTQLRALSERALALGDESFNRYAQMMITGQPGPASEAPDVLVAEASSPATAAAPKPADETLLFYKESLDQLRKELILTLSYRALELLDTVDASLVFSLKDILLLTDLSLLVNDTVVCVEKKKGLAVRLHVLCLILQDKPGALDMSALIPVLGQLLSQPGEWIPFVILIMESYVLGCDVPTETPFSEVAEAEKLASGETSDADLLSAAAVETKTDSLSKTVDSVGLDRFQLVRDLARFLGESSDKDILHATLQLLVVLTKKFELAKCFIGSNGLIHLVDTDHIALFPAQHSLTMMILRHCTETDKVLTQAMEAQMINWVLNPPRHPVSRPATRPVDLNVLLKSNAHFVLRDPDTFVKVASQKLKLIKCDLQRRQFTVNMDALSEPEPFQFKHLEVFSEEKRSTGGQAVQFLCQKLLSLKSIKTEISQTQVHVRRCFILQCLSELVVSYPVAKVDLFNSSQRKSKKVKNLLVSHLVYDLMPKVEKDVELGKMIADESSWASCLLCAMCVGKEDGNELCSIRRIVLDQIIKSIRECQQLAIDQKKDRLISISEVCFRMLNDSTLNNQASTTANKEPHSLIIARIMIEKGFVACFTNILAELDMQHPATSLIIESLLKPLEILSKSAIILGKEINQKEFDHELQQIALEPLTDVSDMFRNSVLGVLEPGSEHSFDESADAEEFTDDDDEDDQEMDDVPGI